jgi:homocysteine S-methyltransferase
MNDGTLLVNPLQSFLFTQGYVVLDGALATELERRGADLDDPLWSAKILLESPELIQNVHYDYFVAGADVAITASYQATFPGFAQRGLDAEQAAELMRLSVHLADAARDQFWREHTQSAAREKRLRPLVAASIGPYGAWLADGSEYRGDYGLSIEQLMEFHRPRVAVLAECVRNGAADLLACETVPCLAEGQALVRLLAEYPDVPAWLSFSCCDDAHVCHGELFATCIAAVADCDQIVAVGLNCTAPQHVPPLLQRARGATQKPLLAYPNSGELWNAQQGTWCCAPVHSDLGQSAVEWHAAGARLLGGCCRTTPADIRTLRSTLQEQISVHKPD